MNKDLFTHQIIGLAMETHRALGPGLDEEFYHQDFVGRLRAAGIEHLSKPRRDLLYRGLVADTFEADVVFDGRLVAELKALRGDFDREHFTQILSYQKFWRINTGMLFDFGKASLLQKRVIYSSKAGEFFAPPLPDFVDDEPLARTIVECANTCLRAIGLGHRESTWTGLMTASFRADGIPFVTNPVATIARHGPAALRCFVIDRKAAVTVTALGTEVSAMDRAYLQTCLRWLDLPWGIALHFGKEHADMKYVTAPNTKSRFPQIQKIH
jgi:GxxExxY protein